MIFKRKAQVLAEEKAKNTSSSSPVGMYTDGSRQRPSSMADSPQEPRREPQGSGQDAGNVGEGSNGVVMEEDDAFESDTDSGYGHSLPDAASISSRVESLLPRHEYRHGRRYHGLHAGSYNFPNDEPEQLRLDMLHYVFTRLLDGKLFLAPIREDATVLDIGTGTGSWPIHFGDSYPGASVVGVDLSPIQPQWVPANVRFSVDDVELDWTEDTYDYIHCRYMAASILDWPALISHCFRHLRPGGWLELQETENVLYTWPPTPELGSDKIPKIPFTTEHPLARLMDGLTTACDRIGRTFNPAPSFEKWCLDSGFPQVEQHHFYLPVGCWPSDTRFNELGALMAVNFTDGVDAFTAALFTDVLDWSREEVKKLNADVVAAAYETSEARPMFEFRVVTAQKPY